jgi:hypothetical protein
MEYVDWLLRLLRLEHDPSPSHLNSTRRIRVDSVEVVGTLICDWVLLVVAFLQNLLLKFGTPYVAPSTPGFDLRNGFGDNCKSYSSSV